MEVLGKTLRLPLTYPKTTLFAVAIPGLLYLFYKAKDLLKIVQLVTSLKSALPTDTLDLMRRSRERDSIYDRLQRTFTVFTPVKQTKCIQLKDQIKRTSQREEKYQLWEELKTEVFVQMLYNVYVCEVYKCAYLVSTHLIARLDVEGQNTTGLADMFEEVHKQIRHNIGLHDFLSSKVSPILSRFPLSHLLTLSSISGIIEACQASIETVIRPASGARFEVLHLAVPEEFGDNLVRKNVYALFLRYFFERQTQEEVMDRAGRLLGKVSTSLQEKITQDGKNNPNRTSLLDWKGLELAHLVSHLDKQEISAVWEPNERLGRQVFYEL